MATYVVVNDRNIWLGYGHFDTPQDAYEEAKACPEYDHEDRVYVYEIKDEVIFNYENPQEAQLATEGEVK